MVQIKKMLVPSSRASRVRFSGTNPKRKIVVHQTGNKDRGANAYMHARLQYNGNSRQASWHYTVDDKVAYQSFSHNDKLWHAGNGSINKESIGVEICVNSDADYDKAVKNGAELVKHIMNVENISLVEVINHHDASGKWCPSEILNGREDLTWSWFKNALGGASGEVTTSSNTKPSSSKPTFSGSIVDYLNQQGIKSNINNRKNLAVEHGIVSEEADYTGTAKQNTDLLNAMMKDGPKQEGTRKEEIQSGYTGNSIVDYLVSIGENASFANRKKLAGQNGISGYTGTAKQNRDLLNKLRGGGSSGGSTGGKSIAQMADEVEANKHGNGHENRRKSLGVSQSVYNQVREEVNRRAGLGASSTQSKSINQMAREVLDNKHGNGHANRRRSLGVSQSTYDKVRAEVNRLAGGGSGQSISQMASKILNDPKAPNGHENRRKWLGIDNATYQKVRAEVNRRA